MTRSPLSPPGADSETLNTNPITMTTVALDKDPEKTPIPPSKPLSSLTSASQTVSPLGSSSKPESPYTSSPPSRPHSPLHGIPQRRNPTNDSMRIAQGIPIPKHMVPPLQDGYRTPTIEDWEKQFRETGETPPSQGQSSAHELPNFNPFSYSRPHSARSHVSITAVSHLLDEKLEWRQRIRHFTWNFFSLTMATGGIANVLYTGAWIARLNLA